MLFAFFKVKNFMQFIVLCHVHPGKVSKYFHVVDSRKS